MDTGVSLIVGSAAAGNSDDLSDLDLISYVQSLPSRAEFCGWLVDSGLQHIGALGSGSAVGFADSFRFEGIELQFSVTLATALERLIREVSEGKHLGDRLTKAVGGLTDALALTGGNQLESWREMAAYPEELALRAVEFHLRQMSPYWSSFQYFAARDSVLFEHQIITNAALNIIGVLSAVNRRYFSPFQYKRMRLDLARMKYLPPDIAVRLEALVTLPRDRAGGALKQLLDETIELAAFHVPMADPNLLRKIFANVDAHG